ncbi:MAG: NAD(P)(+) transhydrogenase (Re/Si-specific) subunit beta [Planctomycetes bacterium]|nr:NAD(P)(+) transhydrogenase (Re/Si-specific) subunit beta [Planctomycetota bacterium]
MNGAADLAYLVAALLFVAAMKAMASARTARLGVLLIAAGVLVAVLVALLGTAPPALTYVYIMAGLLIGALLGAAAALAVRMAAMPALVAVFNSLGALASALVVLAATWTASPASRTRPFAVAAGITSLIGWAVFTGSLAAFARLQGIVPGGRPILLPRRRTAALGALAGAALLIAVLGVAPAQRWPTVPLALLAAGLGVIGVLPIGGADLPAAIALLNSLAALAAAGAGVAMVNPGLIIAGALVCASGMVLAVTMCRAMNRSPAAILRAAVGGGAAGAGAGAVRPIRRWTVEDAAGVLEGASRVIIVPGYGLAAARAQHAAKELADLLAARGAQVRFAIHPAAGRMPGHMNVLLAEAQVPGELQFDLDAVNADFPDADVAVVIGANDVVNPAARTDAGSPLYGMPILDAARARTVLVVNRSDGGGFAGACNPLFGADNAAMVLGDARDVVARINGLLKRGGRAVTPSAPTAG